MKVELFNDTGFQYRPSFINSDLLIQLLRLDYIKSKDKNATCVAIHTRAGR